FLACFSKEWRHGFLMVFGWYEPQGLGQERELSLGFFSRFIFTLLTYTQPCNWFLSITSLTQLKTRMHSATKQKKSRGEP
ncbi:MAG: hypothetical protein KAQ79_14740, partial [Cyclobacteriaceae bacterium]|nr:hypothetical protein [Cyclobacteriaceae bacterium]